MGSIEIPEPVITAEADYEWRGLPDGVNVYHVEVKVGGVIVMCRKYDDDYGSDPENYGHHRPDYADCEEEAQERALAEFGKKIRDLIGEETGD